MFGYAGSSLGHVLKHAALYNSLGYRTLSCVLPQEYLFHYQTAQIVSFSRSVLAAAVEHEMTGVVTHSLSNNGGAVYQHLSQAVTEYQQLEVRGAVFDSCPGPATLFPSLSWRSRPGAAKPPGNLFLCSAYLGVNLANRVSLKETIRRLSRQIKELDKVQDVPWVGDYVKYEDRGDWPLLFIYSRADTLIPCHFVSEVVEESEARGRTVTSLCLERSGHVAHLKTYPDLYTRTISQFLQSL